MDGSWFPVKDVESWAADDQEPLGSKTKEWLRDPARRRWLFKEVRGQDRGLPAEGEDWAEKVAAELAHVMDIPAARVELATRKGRRGIVSLSVLGDDPNAELVHGNELLAEVDPAYDQFQKGPAQGMTVRAVTRALQTVAAAPGSPAVVASGGAPASMASYLLFDALIANTDRHHSNWAIIRWPDGSESMAPSFDHASSLGFNLSAATCEARLTTRDANYTVRAFVERGRGKFEGKPGLVALASEAVLTLDDERIDYLLHVLEQMSPTVWQPILDRVPSFRLSHPSRTFAGEILRLNRERLLHAIRNDRSRS